MILWPLIKLVIDNTYLDYCQSTHIAIYELLSSKDENAHNRKRTTDTRLG